MHYVSEAYEKQIETLQTLATYEAIGRTPNGRRTLIQAHDGNLSPKEIDQWRTDIHGLHVASPFYWNRRTTEIIQNAMVDFKLEEITAVRELAYTDFAWCWFGEVPLFETEIEMADGTRHMAPVRAVTWYVFKEREIPYLGMTAYTPHTLLANGNWSGKVLPTLWACVDLGKTMETTIEAERLTFIGKTDARTEVELTLLKQFVCAAGTFLRQEIFNAEAVPVERHLRKRLDKVGLRTQVSTISVVQLRKTKHGPRAEGPGVPVEWNWQWTVRGHSRQQFYRSLGIHLPVYVRGYLKGPEDKPLKPRTTPIYSVTR